MDLRSRVPRDATVIACTRGKAALGLIMQAVRFWIEIFAQSHALVPSHVRVANRFCRPRSKNVPLQFRIVIEQNLGTEIGPSEWIGVRIARRQAGLGPHGTVRLTRAQSITTRRPLVAWRLSRWRNPRPFGVPRMATRLPRCVDEPRPASLGVTRQTTTDKSASRDARCRSCAASQRFPARLILVARPQNSDELLRLPRRRVHHP